MGWEWGEDFRQRSCPMALPRVRAVRGHRGWEWGRRAKEGRPRIIEEAESGEERPGGPSGRPLQEPRQVTASERG